MMSTSMPSVDPVVELQDKVKDLQPETTETEIISILNYLRHNVKANPKLLRDAEAGLAVGKLRGHTSEEVADLVREVIKKWKTDMGSA